MIFNLVKRIIPFMVVGTIAYFFYTTLNSNIQAVKEIEFSFNVLSVLSILTFVLSVLVTGLLWGKVLNSINNGKMVGAVESMNTQISSWLLKYIPGQAGSLMNKLHWGSKNGYSKSNITISFLYENIFLIIASFALSVPVLFVVTGADTFTSNYLYVLVPMLFIFPSMLLLNKRISHWLLNNVSKRYKNKSIDKSNFLDETFAAFYQLLFMIPRGLIGIAFVLSAVSFLPIEPNDYIPLAATYIFAGTVGILAVFVPSGIGVREAVIVIFASQFMPVEQAIVASLVARLFTTVADIILAIIYMLTKGVNKENPA